LHYWHTHVLNAANLPLGVEPTAQGPARRGHIIDVPSNAKVTETVDEAKGVVRTIIETPITFGVGIGNKIGGALKKVWNSQLNPLPHSEPPKEESETTA
jgi:hypothetical protein